MIFPDISAVSTDQTASPLTWTHTSTAGPNTFLVVGVALAAITTQPSASAVTYNNVSMTKARGDQNGSIVELLETSVWFLFNPPTGVNTVSVTWAGGTATHAGGASSTYMGVQQLVAPDAVSGATGSATGDQTYSITTVADNCWVYTIGVNSAGTSPTITADQTLRKTLSMAATSVAVLLTQDSNASLSAGSQTVGATMGATALQRGWSLTSASFAPYTGDYFRKSREFGGSF